MTVFTRSISFTIPGASGSPGVRVRIEELDGSLVFTLDVLDTSLATADLRGLFFRLADGSKLAGLRVTSHDGTVTDFQAIDNRVIDLGNGANMTGAVSKTNAFDVGVEFGTAGIGGDDIQFASFTLGNTAGNLTLDDVAQTLFGARLTSVGAPDGARNGSVKLLATAPAAPDARDDTYSIFEDGTASLADPRSAPAPVIFHVLANDTDADGDVLTVTHLSTSLTAAGGTVEIVDGDDDDLLPGDAIRYTPRADFSGPDSFTYAISDGKGGTDFATVFITVVAVADRPDVTYQLFDTGMLNQVRLVVTATQTDDDGSEFIDKLAFAGSPGVVTVTPNDALDPADQPASLTREFLVTLPNAAAAFTLDVTATAKEVSNGDTETSTVGVTFHSIFEDGAAGLGDPRSTPAFVLLDLPVGGGPDPIASLGAALHGTLTLVDGDTVRYTPDADYSGWDSFTYVTASGAAGQASITVNAVADIPELAYEILAGLAVNQVVVRVTAAITDDDGSEFIDRLAFSGVPASVMITAIDLDPAGQPASLTRDFVLTLPMDTTTNFVLDVTATSKERSNGDTETASVGIAIDYDYKVNALDTTFQAVNQSIWGSGDAFTFTDDRFLGINESLNGGFNAFLFAQTTGNLKAGFQSTLNFTGGSVDASVPYAISVDTNFNRTTDVMVIGSSASLLSGGGFTTTGPGGDYTLDFIFELLFALRLGLDFGDLGQAVFVDSTLIDIDERLNILSLDSDNLGFSLSLPLGFSIDFAWPNIPTTSNTINPYTSSGASNDFLALNLDVDDFITKLLKLPVNPFAPGFDVDIGVAAASVVLELIDLDLGVGLNLLQQFAVAVNSLATTIVFEDGSTQAYMIGTDLVLTGASAYDADNDGKVEFVLVADPQATMSNSTDLGFNFNWNFDVLKGSYNFEVFDVDAGGGSFGPLIDLGGTIPIASVDVFNTSFALDFQSRDLVFFA